MDVMEIVIELFDDSIPEPEVHTIADQIQLMLLDADQLAMDGKFYEASLLAGSASAMAYQTGDVVLATNAGCDAHRYNARVRSMASFWQGFTEFCHEATTRWVRGCDQDQIAQIKTLLHELEQFGYSLDDQDQLSA